MATSNNDSYVSDSVQVRLIRIKCPDQKGLVSRLTSIMYKHSLNIIRNNTYSDSKSNMFYMCSVVKGYINETVLLEELREIVTTAGTVSLFDQSIAKRLAIMVTKEVHCVGDILIKMFSGAMNIQIVCVVGNWDNELRGLTEKFDIPYHHISHIGFDNNREAHEQQIIDCINSYGRIDYVILAKYMRILTLRFVQEFENRIINIHHSFLPAFIGANPYKQAHERGVKIIGATAHFVTTDLDEGPIIHQGVTNVNHTMDWKKMAAVGREVERSVLSKAISMVINDSVFIDGRHTIILE